MLGEAAGLAASLACRYRCSTHQIFSEHLDELKNELEQGVPIPEPHSYAAGFMESYHFMRPIGAVGNDKDENCWVGYDRQGNPRGPIPPSLKQNIRKLGSLHLKGKDDTWKKNSETEIPKDTRK